MTRIPTGTFNFPTRVIFGGGVVGQVAEQAVALGMKRPLIVTDGGMVAVGLLATVLAPFERNAQTCSVFSGVEPNPTEKSVFPAVEQFRTEGCDGIIGLGGGSSLDAAKAIRLALTHSRPLAEYDDLLGGDRYIRADMPAMIAIPTTAGTGSEVSRSTVIDLTATQRKTVIFSPYLIPNVVLADPLMTLKLPPNLTAWTGIDALTHNVEAYLARGFHPICDGVALHGVTLIGQYLARAVENGADEEARAHMLMASMMGAVAFQKGLGATHSLAHPLSSVAGLHHGLANAIMLPHVLRFNCDAVPERLADIGQRLGVTPDAEAAIAAVRALLDRVHIPRRLSEVGVTPEHVDRMVGLAMADGCHPLNPRPCTPDDFQMMYRAAL